LISGDPINIDYYSDVLCVWAWIAQARLEELETQWQGQASVSHHYVDIFGDCHRKIPAAWGERDGFEKFARHVHDSAAPFDAADVHPDIWKSTRPRSSAQAHLVLRATAIAHDESKMAALALNIRQAFFLEARDIGNLNLLLEMAQDCDCEPAALRQCLDDGSAIAAYSTDLRRAGELGVRGSPTWILNGGRQVLYGNVGYRILNANIEELLRHPQDEASWC
jgi:predicted DsbA family dithiol-disulfide isomerase